MFITIRLSIIMILFNNNGSKQNVKIPINTHEVFAKRVRQGVIKHRMFLIAMSNKPL